MQNDLVPIPAQPDVSIEIDFGKCTQCRQDLEESEFAIGNICDGCRPAFMEGWEAQQDAAAEEAAEFRMYPEWSDDELGLYGAEDGRYG